MISVCMFVTLGQMAIAVDDKLPVLKTNTRRLDYQLGNEFYKGQWTISPEPKPDILNVFVPSGKKLKVTFFSDIGQISFDVAAGESYDFNIVMNQDVCWTRINGLKLVPAATYDDAYIQTHRGKVEATVPEVYELVNIAISLTDFARAKNWPILTNTEYGKEVIAWFDQYRADPVILALDKQLKVDSSVYDGIRMNGNAFVFEAGNRILPRREYSRTGYPYEKTNALEPFVTGLSEFAERTQFRAFYKTHQQLYRKQKEFFSKEADAFAVTRWLEKAFPESPKFDFTDIVFSPIAGGSNSVTWFESNGFRTLQPHVNFPFADTTPALRGASSKANAICRSSFLFTEMGRGYLAPVSAAYAKSIRRALTKSERWVDKTKFGNFNSTWLFETYMNWGLIALWANEIVPDEADSIADFITGMMKERGFLRFKEFQQALLRIYRSKRPTESVADLYPQILKWLNEQN